jgi:acyl-coenzyme A thioesterase PaaI-like protein
VLHRGKRVATADGRVTRASDGKLLAHGKSTCMIMPVG